MRVIAFLNQKGGVGKTSCCHHLSGTLAAMGRRVLLVDNDPQASLTQGLLGTEATAALDPGGTLAAVYEGSAPSPAAIARPSGTAGVDLVAGSRHVGRYNLADPTAAPGRSQGCLARFLAGCEGYDLALVDCPPNLHLCAWAALLAATHLVVPLQAEDYGAQGIAPVRELFELACSGPNPGLTMAGYLLTMFMANLAVHQLYEGDLRAMYGGLVFGAPIPHATAFKEAIARRMPIVRYAPKSKAARATEAVALELLGRVERPAAAGSPAGVA